MPFDWMAFVAVKNDKDMTMMKRNMKLLMKTIRLYGCVCTIFVYVFNITLSCYLTPQTIDTIKYIRKDI